MPLSRRHVVGLLGVSVVWGLASGRLTALRSGSPRTKKLSFPKDAIIRTVLKDLPPEEMGPGVTLFHEHIASDSVDDLMIEEIIAARKQGVSCVVNAKSNMAPNLENLRAISTRTSVHILACGGYFNQNAYPPELATKSEDQIADDLTQEAHSNGLGAFGEIGQSDNSASLTPEELKVFRAVGKAHLRTNLPIFTHNAYGTGPNVPREAGLRQLDAFESVGVKPQHVAIGHMCCLDDPRLDIIKQVAKRGAFVGFDRMADHHTQWPTGSALLPYGARRFPNVQDISDEQRVREILEFLDLGYMDQLLLADDSINQPLHVSAEISQMVKDQWLPEGDGEQIKAALYKDMGMGRAVTVFVPMLRKAGVKEETLHTILHDNPRRFLAFEPKES
jgi:phosphotriesterase-related protein